MKSIKTFCTLTLLGGLAVVLPLAIFMVIAQWLFALLTDAIQPLTNEVSRLAGLREFSADVVVLAFVVALCFFIGLMVRTSVGRWLHLRFDRLLSKLAPGYRIIREVVAQFMGSDDSTTLLNGRVCVAQIFGEENPATVTGIVTDEHKNGDYTVFVPTAPIPTSGMVYHLPARCVQLLPNVSVETAMRTVIGCGAGSKVLFSVHS